MESLEHSLEFVTIKSHLSQRNLQNSRRREFKTFLLCKKKERERYASTKITSPFKQQLKYRSVNDPAVLKAFAKNLKVEKQLTFLADYDASFTKAIEMDVDLKAAKLGNKTF